MKKEFMTIGVERKLKQKTFKDNAKLWFEQKKYLSQSFANGVIKARKTVGVVLVSALIFQMSMGVFGTSATTTGTLLFTMQSTKRGTTGVRENRSTTRHPARSTQGSRLLLTTTSSEV